MDNEDIRKLRDRLGISQEELARRLNVTASSVYRWETGKVQPSRLALEKIESLEREEGVAS